MTQASRGAAAQAPAVGRRKGVKAELDGLRERMRALGLGHGEIAAEVSRRYQVRPRQAYRLAWGWTQDQAAARFNEQAAGEGTDPEGRAAMTGPRLGEVEQWPNSERRPSAYALCLLAGLYDTGVLSLLDLADHESLPQQDRLVLMRRLPARAPFGERVLALMEARGLSLREAARRVPCDVSHLSRVVHGRRSPSLRVAARLDDVLDAAGELAALADATAPGGGPGPGREPGRQPGEAPASAAGGVTLTPPFVPGRLVIEVCGPAGNPGLLAGGSDDLETAPGRLALVRDTAPGTLRGEAAGR